MPIFTIGIGILGSNMLEKIKNRYFRNNKIDHHGDCCIYQSIEAYGWAICTCGLLHDLDYLDGSKNIYEIYPNYYKDYELQNRSGKII